MSSKPKSESGKAKVTRSRPRTRQLSWRLPALSWILSGGRPLESVRPLSRVLISGACPEALILAKNYPEAEIVVTDPSEKLTRSLRLSARRRQLSNLTAFHTPLHQTGVADIIGGNFDLILVVEIPISASAYAGVVENLSICLAKPSGRLYLKLPGDGHPFMRPTEVLSAFKLPSRLANSVLTDPPPVLQLAAAMAGDEFWGSAAFPYTTLGLGDWISVLRAKNLHLAAALHVPAILSRALHAGGVQSLMDFGAEDLALALDTLARPVNRHLIFSVTELCAPPFHDIEALAQWRPLVQFWPRDKIPEQKEAFSRLMNVEIQIQTVLPPLKINMSGFMLEFLRLCDGSLSIHSILEKIPHKTSITEILQALYFFHHSCIFSLQPPVE